MTLPVQLTMNESGDKVRGHWELLRKFTGPFGRYGGEGFSSEVDPPKSHVGCVDMCPRDGVRGYHS